MRILGSLGGNEYILHVRGLYIGEAAFKMVPSDLCLLLLSSSRMWAEPSHLLVTEYRKGEDVTSEIRL